MSDHVQQTLNMIVDQVQGLERQVADKKRTANDLSMLLGGQPMFAEITQANVGVSTLPDEYYGRQAQEVIRTILEKRKRVNRGAATVSEIYEAMTAGGYVFEAQKPEYAKRGIYGVLGSGDEFHKLPGGAYGLASWYPAAKTKTEPKPARKLKAKKSAGKKVAHPKAKEPATPPVPERPVEKESKPTEEGGQSQFGKGDLLKLVRETIKLLPEKFSTVQAMNRVAERNGAEIQPGSFKAVLAKLVTLGEIEVLQKGVGRRPSVYRLSGA